MEDGGWRMEDGGWRMEDGVWNLYSCRDYGQSGVPIKFALPDSVPDFHVDLPDRSPVKRKMTRHWEWGITCYLLVTTSMTETFDVLPDQGPVNF